MLMQILAFVLFGLVIVCVIGAIHDLRKSNADPFLWLIGAGVLAMCTAWAASSSGLNYLGGLASNLVMPVCFTVAGGMGIVYGYQAIMYPEAIGLLGDKHGYCADPNAGADADAEKKRYTQWDFGILMILLGVLFLLFGLYCFSPTIKSIEKAFKQQPELSAMEKVAQLSDALDSVREKEKLLNARMYSFEVTLYPEEFPGTDTYEALKDQFDDDIADLDLEVKEFSQVRIEEVGEDIDLVGSFTTASTIANQEVPSGFTKMTVRKRIETGLGAEVWIADNILPRIQTMHDKARGIDGTISAPSGSRTRPEVQRTPFSLPERNNRIGSGN